MTLYESLNSYMESVKKERREIEAFANKSLQKLGLTGPRCVDRVYSKGNQTLSLTFSAESELNLCNGEETGLRILFDVDSGDLMKVKVAAFFSKKLAYDLISVRLIQCEGIDNPNHQNMLENEIRTQYPKDRIKRDTVHLCEQDSSQRLAKFVRDSCKFLCRAHFRP